MMLYSKSNTQVWLLKLAGHGCVLIPVVLIEIDKLMALDEQPSEGAGLNAAVQPMSFYLAALLTVHWSRDARRTSGLG